jgi:hypothetical protein
MGWFDDDNIIRKLNIVIENQAKNQKEILTALANFNRKLDALISNEIAKPATSFIATITLNTNNNKGEIMGTPVKATADLVVADNGTFTVTNNFQDADLVKAAVPAGLALTYTPSDATPGPSILLLTPSADTASCQGAINQDVVKALNTAGTPLPTGVTVIVAGTWTGLAAPASIVANPAIDVGPGPANSFVPVVSTP